jgi:hypothetical protein
MYEIASPQVLVSPEWAHAGEAGRWPSQGRPFTRNRRHRFYKILYAFPSGGTWRFRAQARDGAGATFKVAPATAAAGQAPRRRTTAEP